MIMDVSRKTLIISVIINFVLIAICAACLIISNFNPIVLWISVAVLAFVLLTSIMAFVMGKKFRK